MDAVKTVERRIEDGFVFDEHGRWIYMSELRAHEKRVIDELGKGNVLFDGRWVPIGEARRLARPSIPFKQASMLRPPAPPRPRAAADIAADAPTFEAQDNMLETICIDAAVIRQLIPGAGGADANPGNANKNNADTDSDAIVDFQAMDELHETAVFTMERVDTAASANLPATSKNIANVNTGGSVSNDTSANGKDLSAEVDGVLLFGLSKSAAAEQSKYAMEYIEEFQFSRKRRNLFNGLAIASVSLAVAAAIALIIFQNLD